MIPPATLGVFLPSICLIVTILRYQLPWRRLYCALLSAIRVVCMRSVAHCRRDLGMHSGEIADSAITASSSYDERSVGPIYARSRSWLQFCLFQLHHDTRSRSVDREHNSCTSIFSPPASCCTRNKRYLLTCLLYAESQSHIGCLVLSWVPNFVIK